MLRAAAGPRLSHGALDRRAPAVEVRVQLRLQGASARSRSSRSGSRPACRSPPFLYISITNACNLRCQGCWVDVDKPQHLISYGRPEPADRQCEAARQQLLRHPGGRAVHAPGPHPGPRGAPRLLLPDLHQRPPHHRRRSRAAAEGGERDAAHQRRGHRVDQRRPTRPRGGADRTLEASGPAYDTADHRRLHQRLPVEHRRSGARGVDRPVDPHGGALLLVPHVPGWWGRSPTPSSP